MAKKTIKAETGIGESNSTRYYFDIYAILEGSQELYFGHETQVNVNLVETILVATKDGEIEKCYLSPTKRRGVERRTLISAPTSSGWLLGDKLGCGIPHTCCKLICPICSVFGGLITEEQDVEFFEKKTDPRKPTTYNGRLIHGGGVAIQAQDVSEKQRAMHPSKYHKNPSDDSPVPFKRQYNEPGLFYPVYNHCLSITETEFSSVAFAFLQSLPIIGASNPKGVKVYEDTWNETNQIEPFLVLDRYLSPLGNRPVVSPHITSIEEAISRFKADALEIAQSNAELIKGDQNKKNEDSVDSTKSEEVKQMPSEEKKSKEILFKRWIGKAAYTELQNYSSQFVINTLRD